MTSYSVYHNANFQSFVRHNYQPMSVKTKYDDIRCKAQLQHTQEIIRKTKSATAYAGEYGFKRIDKDAQSVMRPSSPTRINKPHPPEIFLVTTLHNLPGYYNSKKMTASEKKDDIYKKILTLPAKKTASGNNSQVQIFHDTNSNMAAQAWLRLASDKDRDTIKSLIKFVSEKNPKKIDSPKKKDKLYQAFIQSVKPEFVTSAQQWLMEAGPTECATVERLLQTLSTAPQKGPSIYRQFRAEYVIHPDWRKEH